MPAPSRMACTALATALACSASLAQPVQLRLARSLCASTTSQVLTSQLVPALASSASPAANVNAQLAARMEEQRAAWFGRLDALKPFSGVYATGQADHSFLDSQGGRYSFGLEWELYDNGRAEAKRTLERLRLEDKLQYLQAVQAMAERHLQENLLAIDRMRSRLLAQLYDREAAAIAPVLERHRQAAAAGRMTKAELAQTEYRAQAALLRGTHHAATPDVLMYPQAHELVNRIEEVQLLAHDELVDRAVSRSPDHQMQALLAARGEFLPSVKDTMSVRLYVERSKDFERSPHNVAGVRWRIPIGSDTGREGAIEASRSLHRQQQDSVRAALSQQLALLTERMRLAQTAMRVLQAENAMLRTRAEGACYRLDFPVASVPGDPERDVEDIVLQLYGKQREILTARLDVLEVLTRISALVKPRDPRELYVLREAR